MSTWLGSSSQIKLRLLPSLTDVQVRLYPVDFSRPGRREGLVLTCPQPGKTMVRQPPVQGTWDIGGTLPQGWTMPSPAWIHQHPAHTLCGKNKPQLWDNWAVGWFSIVIYVHAKLLQSCPTLCDPKDSSLPGSSVHEILQAWKLEWDAVPSSRGSSWSRDWTHVSYVFCIITLLTRVIKHTCL